MRNEQPPSDSGTAGTVSANFDFLQSLSTDGYNTKFGVFSGISEAGLDKAQQALDKAVVDEPLNSDGRLNGVRTGMAAAILPAAPGLIYGALAGGAVGEMTGLTALTYAGVAIGAATGAAIPIAIGAAIGYGVGYLEDKYYQSSHQQTAINHLKSSF